MQIQTFLIPVYETLTQEHEVNRFLRTVKVLEIKRELIVIDNSAFWAICVLYLGSVAQEKILSTKEKIDYKNVLSPENFAVFSRLRKIRKKLAERDAVPAFAVFTDAELSEISKLNKISVETIKGIYGIGAKRAEKYANEFSDLYVMDCANEEDSESI